MSANGRAATVQLNQLREQGFPKDKSQRGTWQLILAVSFAPNHLFKNSFDIVLFCADKVAECDICRMRFAAPQSMLQHRRIHTGEKPWKCKYCSKAYPQQSACSKSNLDDANDFTKSLQPSMRGPTQKKSHQSVRLAAKDLQSLPTWPSIEKHTGTVVSMFAISLDAPRHL